MSLASILKGPGTALGGWCSMPNVVTFEMMARKPFDYLCIDTQHGWITEADLLPLLQAAQASTASVLVRVAANTPQAIERALSCGGDGVVVPMVNSVEDAERAVRACRYPPVGQRSWGQTRLAPHHDPAAQTPADVNARILCFVMIESIEGVHELVDIVNVDGIDGVYIGPSDLALTHHMKPTFRLREAEHFNLLESILDVGRRAGIPTGLHCPDAAEAARWHERGFRMLTVASDFHLFGQALGRLDDELANLRSGANAVLGNSSN